MGDMKTTIKSVSIDLFFEKGYFATSISDIARGSGIQKASIYYHYASKADLLFRIMSATMDDLTTTLKERLAAAGGIEVQMRAAVRGHVCFHLERQKENFIANSELRGLSAEHYRAIVRKRDEYESIFQQLIHQGTVAGVFADVDVKILSYAILTLCTAGATWYNPNGRLTVDEIADIYENFIISGLKQGCLTPLPAAEKGIFNGTQ
ncbi:TetR family transcriptional regulator [Desulfosarcina alkanivorans]|uniref:TetR family transcriptional regulator n=1 Tax=Desulfosarcina alkanivorans TaxID=571177 RepID=A0A5K7YQ47_9BACT|nr:TetR/AcrR family transcriptional regulator [Desulfosarcina alkanivorans]BBO70490.1 TetR family transcriptional regulator [Desulfosarcina alkanivorans]